MPELPEVETTVLSLKNKVLEKTFVSLWSEKKRDDINSLKGKRIVDIKRYGKGIFFYLHTGDVLYIHLKMTGHLLYGKWTFSEKEKTWISREKVMQERKNGFLRYIFFLNNGYQLAFSDPRKFGVVFLLSKEEGVSKIKSLGTDALSFKKNDFVELLSRKKTKIKPLLMDQRLIAGIGNIYAAEILFLAKIDPKKRADFLTKKDAERVYDVMRKILKKALRLKGDSTSDYRLITGEKGGYQEHHLVYNRKGKPCFECKKEVKRIVVGSRGTYYCPSCQGK